MNSIKSAEKVLERIRSSGSYPSHSTPDRHPPSQRGTRGWFAGDMHENSVGPSIRMRRERSRTAELTVGDSDDEDHIQESPGAGSVADDKLRELNASGLDALASGNIPRARQLLENALAAANRGNVADVGLSVSTYGNYGTLLLAAGRNIDKAVDVLADAIVRFSRVPPDMQSLDLERSLESMHTALATAMKKDTGDIRLEFLSQYSAGALLERKRQGFECLEHLRIAHDLSRTCMGMGHPTHKAISSAFDRAKKAYAAGGTTFQSKKAHLSQKKCGMSEADVNRKTEGDDDFLGDDGGLGLFEKGLSTDVWSALKNEGKSKPKGVRVNAGTASKASLADRNLKSRGDSRGGRREPSPDLFAPGAAKKSNFLANLLGESTSSVDGKTSMPSITQKPRSQQKPPPSQLIANKRSSSRKDGQASRRPISPVTRPLFLQEEEIPSSRTSGKTPVPPQQVDSHVGRGGLKEISVPVPRPMIDSHGRHKTPERSGSSSNARDATERSKTSSAASSASTDASAAPKQRPPAAAQVDEEDDEIPSQNDSCDESRASPVAMPDQDTSIDDMIGELCLEKEPCSPNLTSQLAEQVHEDSDDADAPQFMTLAKHDKEGERRKHIAAGDSAASLAQEKLKVGDLTAAREALVDAGKEWQVAGLDKTRDLAALAGNLALEIAREKLVAADLLGAREALGTAALEWKKAGENRNGELADLEGAIAEAAIHSGRAHEAADIFSRALEIARESCDVPAQTAACAKLGKVLKLLGRNDEAVEILKHQLELYSKNEDIVGQTVTYGELGYAYQAAGSHEDAIRMFTNSLNLSQTIGNAAEEYQARVGLGQALGALGRLQEASEMLSKAVEIANNTRNVAGSAAALMSLGGVCMSRGKHADAIITLQTAIQIAENSGDSGLLCKVISALGSAHTAQGKDDELTDGEKTRATLQHYDEAVDLHSKALEIAKKVSDVATECASCNGLAIAYEALGRREEAIEMFSRALEMMETLGDQNGMARALNSMGHARRYLGKFDEAVAMHTRSLKLAEQNGDASIQAAAYLGLAHAYKSLGRCSEALKMFEKAEHVAKIANIELDQHLTHEWNCSATALLTIQCNFRMHLARKAMLTAMSNEYGKNIVRVQASVRRCLVRTRYSTQIKRKRALLKIECTTLVQSKFRMAIANHRWLNSIQGILCASARVRVKLECFHRAKRNAAVALQAALRARDQHIQGRKVIESGLKVKRSRVLQAAFRRYLPRKCYREETAAIKFQAYVRRHLSIITFAIHRAARSTSRHSRAAICRHKYAKMVAAILIGAYWRALMEQKKWQTLDGAALQKSPAEFDIMEKELATDRRLAVECIQARIRRLFQRQIGMEQMLAAKQEDSCCHLQAVIRQRLARNTYIRGWAKRTIQAAVRRSLARSKRLAAEKAFSELSHVVKRSVARRGHSCRFAASVKLQAILRQNLGSNMGRAQLNENRQSFSCQILQAIFRSTSKHELYRKELASRTIQSAIRREIAGEGMHSCRQACFAVEGFLKAALLRRRYSETQMAAQKVQAVLRRSRGQWEGQTFMHESQREFSVRTLQAVCRCSLARESYRKVVASCTIQAALHRSRHFNIRLERSSAVTDIQRIGKSAIRTGKYTETRESTIKLQANLRSKLDHSHGSSMMRTIRISLAAADLEAACRRTLAREMYRKYLATCTVQAAIRCQRAGQFRTGIHLACTCMEGYMMAAIIRQRYAAESSATIQLQAVMRRHKGFVEGILHMEESHHQTGALVLSANCRRALIRGNYGKLIAAHILQAAVRRTNCLLEYQVQIVAHATLVSFLKASVRRWDYSAKLSASITLQSVLRRQMGRAAGEVSIFVYRKEIASQILQAFSRRTQARKAYMQDLAVRILQAALRRIRTGHERQVAQRACDILQHIAKQALARTILNEQRTAATRLQAAVCALSGFAEGQRQMQETAAHVLQAACRRALAQQNYIQRVSTSALQAAVRRKLHFTAEGDRKAKEAEQERQKAEEEQRAKEEEEKRLEDLRNAEERKQKENEDAAREEQMRQEQAAKEAEKKNLEEEEERRQAAELAKKEEEERMLKEEEDRVRQEEEAAERALKEETDRAEREAEAARKEAEELEKALEEEADLARQEKEAEEQKLRQEEAEKVDKEEAKRKRKEERKKKKEDEVRNESEEADEDGVEEWPQEGTQQHHRNREREKGKKSKGADWERDMTPLAQTFRHVRYGNYRDVEQKLEEGIDVDARGGIKNNTLLCEAACHGHQRIVKLLLRSKANINAQNQQGNTSLHLAMEFNYKKVGDYLVEKGAKTNVRNSKGRTPYEMEGLEDPDGQNNENSPNQIRGGGRS